MAITVGKYEVAYGAVRKHVPGFGPTYVGWWRLRRRGYDPEYGDCNIYRDTLEAASEDGRLAGMKRARERETVA